MSLENMIISRDELIKLLLDWQSAKISAKQVHDWAEARLGLVDYKDWEDNNSHSVTNEVLGALDMLDMNLITSEDISFYLEFLNTPAGNFHQGYDQWQISVKAVNYAERRNLLRDTIPYASVL